MTEDELVGQNHRLNGHEFEQAPGAGDGQGSPVCRSPWGQEELDTTERLDDENEKPHHKLRGNIQRTNSQQKFFSLEYMKNSYNTII